MVRLCVSIDKHEVVGRKIDRDEMTEAIEECYISKKASALARVVVTCRPFKRLPLALEVKCHERHTRWSIH